MKTVTMVRAYLTEEKDHLDSVLKHLHDQGKVRGVTVFRGIAGFGASGVMHTSALTDLSLNLPVVIEFFEEPAKAQALIAYLNTLIGPGRIVSWPAELSSNG
jgi:PII-like signaling protein